MHVIIINHPANSGTIATTTLNARGYLDVAFADNVGLNTGTITDSAAEFTLTGTPNAFSFLDETFYYRSDSRTGKPVGGGSSSPGGASCSGYTITAGSGTVAFLQRDWEAGIGSDSRLPWWRGLLFSCSQSRAVWCVED